MGSLRSFFEAMLRSVLALAALAVFTEAQSEAPWTSATCAQFTGKPPCTSTQTAECTLVQDCDGCPTGTTPPCSNKIAYTGQTDYSCCTVPTGAGPPTECAM